MLNDFEIKRSWEKLYAVLGLLGLILPLLDVWKCGWVFPPSISDSYYLGAIVPFVVILGALGILLFCNTGYDERDKWCNRMAGVAAFGVISFPCKSPKYFLQGFPLLHMKGVWTGIAYPTIHYISAILLFSIFAFMCFAVFPQIRSEHGMTPNKRIRNLIYWFCGWLILLGMAAAKFENIYWGEVIMLEAFGIAYMIQGKIILKDR